MSRLRHVSRLMIACSLMTVAGCQPKEKAEQQSTHPNVTISQERPLTIQGNASGVVSYAPAVKAGVAAVGGAAWVSSLLPLLADAVTGVVAGGLVLLALTGVQRVRAIFK